MVLFLRKYKKFLCGQEGVVVVLMILGSMKQDTGEKKKQDIVYVLGVQNNILNPNFFIDIRIE